MEPIACSRIPKWRFPFEAQRTNPPAQNSPWLKSVSNLSELRPAYWPHLAIEHSVTCDFGWTAEVELPKFDTSATASASRSLAPRRHEVVHALQPQHKKVSWFFGAKKCISETWAWVISGNKPCQVRFHAFFAMPTLALKLTWSLPSQFSKQQGSNKASWKFPVWYDDFPVAVSIGGFHSQRCLSLIPRGHIYIPYLEDWWWTWMNYTMLGPTKNVSGMHRLHHFGALTCSCFLMVKL